MQTNRIQNSLIKFHCSSAWHVDSSQKVLLYVPWHAIRLHTSENWPTKNNLILEIICSANWILLGFAVLQKMKHFNLIRLPAPSLRGRGKSTGPSSKTRALHTLQACLFAYEAKLFCYVPWVDDYAQNWYLNFREILRPFYNSFISNLFIREIKLWKWPPIFPKLLSRVLFLTQLWFSGLAPCSLRISLSL